MTSNPIRQPSHGFDLSSDQLLFTIEEAAHLLCIGRTTVYELIKVGELRPVHIGRSARLSRGELQRYVARLDAPPVPIRRTHRATTGQAELFTPDPPPHAA